MMKKTALLLSVFMVNVMFSFAQTQTTQAATTTATAKVEKAASACKNKKTSKKLLKRGNYEEAIKSLSAGTAQKPKNCYFAKNLAAAELQVRDYKDANLAYKKLVDRDSSKHKYPQLLLQYGLTQKALGQYEEAEQTFKQAFKYAPKKDNEVNNELKRRARREAEGCRRAIFFRDSVETPPFTSKLMSSNINQSFTEFSPVLKGDDVMYFSSLRSDKTVEVKKSKDIYSSFARIYKSVKVNGEWVKAEEISENVNAPGVHVVSPTFTEDGKTMYYNQCAQDKNASFRCDIYKSTMVNGVWEKGVSAGAVNDPLFTSAQPAVGKNKEGENVVYYVSNKSLTRGLDIYYAPILEDGKLGRGRSVGSAVNSKLDDVSPFFDAKTGTLYFSSNGWPTVGGFDVFKTSWDNGGEWTEPENLGFPVNSSADDVFFSLNGLSTKGFVVSNRAGGLGEKSETCCDDIYELRTTKLFLAVKGKVYEESNGVRELAQSGNVSLVDERNNFEVDNYGIIRSQFFFNLAANRGYKLSAKKDGFREVQLSFNTDGRTDSDTLEFDLVLKRKVEQNPLIGNVVGSIYYGFDKVFAGNATDTLAKVEQLLNQFPGLVIEIASHTDAIGKAAYNQKLSERRSAAMLKYFTNKKYDAKRFVAKGYGASQPAAPNKTEKGTDNPAGRAQNRRTDFVVIDEIK
jgi:outer membrane protein OmpA-like peptidoglycan-associated protein/tetratricopeptide (TPR) repeat protein